MNIFLRDISSKLQRVQVDPSVTPHEISKMLNMIPSNESILTYVKNGEILSPYLTIGFQGIVEGDTIHVISRKLNTKQKTFSFCNEFQKRMRRYETESNDQFREILRLADLYLIQFEFGKSMDNVFRQNIESSSFRNSEVQLGFQTKNSFTETDDNMIQDFISDKPLPTCWNIDD